MGSAPSVFRKKKKKTSSVKSADESKDTRHFLITGTTESEKHALLKQIKYIYQGCSDDDLISSYQQCFKMDSIHLLSRMVLSTDQMKSDNLSIIPKTLSVKSEPINDESPNDEIRVAQSFRFLSEIAFNLRRIIVSDENESDELEDVSITQVIDNLKCIWTEWSQVWDVWTHQCDRYHFEHELTYFFRRLVDSTMMEPDWSLFTSEMHMYQFMDFTLDDYFRLPGYIDESEHSISVEKEGAIVEVISHPLHIDETQHILDHWARMECGLGKEYWYYDVINLVNRFLIGNMKMRSKFKMQTMPNHLVFHCFPFDRHDRRKQKLLKDHITEMDGIIYVSSLLIVVSEKTFGNGETPLEQDLELFKQVIQEANLRGIQKGIWLLSHSDILAGLLERDIPMHGVWDHSDHPPSEYRYQIGLTKLDEIGMSKEQWMVHCAQKTIDAIQRVYLSVEGATEFIKEVMVLNPCDTEDVCRTLLSPRMFRDFFNLHPPMLV